MTDTLQELLDAQSELQTKMPTTHPTELYAELTSWQEGELGYAQAADGVTEFIQWNHKALIHEVVELEAETGWKPWATKSFVNIEAARGEAIDMLHFLLNDFLVLGMDSREVMMRYRNKHAKNAKRQEEGYDGVSTKCPGCNRALDDDAVDCHPYQSRLGGDELVDGVMCVVRGRFVPNKAEVLELPAFFAPKPPSTGTHLEGSFS